MLKLGRRPGEEIIIGEGDYKITIRVFEVNGNQVCIGIDAPKHISVHREEIYRRIQAERDGK